MHMRPSCCTYAHGLAHDLCRDLYIAFGMVLAVYNLWGNRDDIPADAMRVAGQGLNSYEGLLEAEMAFLYAAPTMKPHDLLIKSASRVLEDRRGRNLELLLWYVEWGTNIRHTSQYDALRYRIWVREVFLPKSGGNVNAAPYWDGNLCYRAMLLHRLTAWQARQ